MKRKLGTAITVPVVALLCLVAGSPAGSAPTAGAADDLGSPLTLTTSRTVDAYHDGKRAWFDPMARLVAETASFELRSTRASYGDPIVTTLRRGEDEVTLPPGAIDYFGNLKAFLRFEYRRDGELIRTGYGSACLNTYSSERIRPDAPLRSPYPQFCAFSKITLGSVMGVEEGYASLLEGGQTVRLEPGRYQVTARINLMYRRLFDISKADGSSTFTLRVRKDDAGEESHRRPRSPSAHDRLSLEPADHEPSRRQAGEPAGPMPDLRSVPAFGIRLNKGKNFLQFSGTVWNAGNSPLVVDGFRRKSEAVMDAYQYFLDADGNQVGYQQVGEMEWDKKDTHLHWHFRDFARYRLLDKDKSAIVRSRKEAFCLANTDAIDYTVEGADWQPDQTDLHTACGERDSLSIREVLASGSGDTYAQFRAGQSFDLRGLPNGIYYISVEANPMHRLVESDTTNNIAYRKVKIGGTLGARTVYVYPMTAK